ncbi:Na+/H+ antiporter NhaA, partial [Desulfobulbus sp. N3]|nr:Na+/H+ antiporter NhaA [Desulfobulbus sp. N3]
MKKKASRFIANFFNMEASGGILLMLTAIVAVICANSGLAHLYEKLLHIHFLAWIPGVNEMGMNLSLLHFINDGLMAVFF